LPFDLGYRSRFRDQHVGAGFVDGHERLGGRNGARRLVRTPPVGLDVRPKQRLASRSVGAELASDVRPWHRCVQSLCIEISPRLLRRQEELSIQFVPDRPGYGRSFRSFAAR
jgi:hypothetical protein